MTRQVVRRLLAAVPVMLLVSLGVFTLLHLIPGDPVVTLLGERAAPEVVEQLRADLGLDRPLPEQYLTWLARLLRGDLGRSIRSPQPVREAIWQRLPVTLHLAIQATFLSLLLALPLGVLAAVYQDSIADRLTTLYASIGVAVPTFWLGVMFILLFSLRLHWLPPSGYTSLAADPLESLKQMLMPAFSLAFVLSAEVARMTRASLLEVLNQDYIRTARAKGLPERAVLLRHGLKNAMIPVVTVIGLQLGRLFGGAVVVETVFALPGLGRLLVDSIFARDFPVVQGVVLFMALMVVISNLFVDLLYVYLDPRIRYG
ncbi:MAG: ABC transporter permease [Ardenticatenaceae bacterium]|nr:ABC transporter permease [Ardenticatenaceae bacterium]HBY98230.1 peptide ABC transporter [Chloroflexota bacterium]